MIGAEEGTYGYPCWLSYLLIQTEQPI